MWQLFIESDESTVLTEEYTFASSLNSGKSRGAKFYPIKTDGEGMIPEDLEKVLDEWDEISLGQKPKLIYTIPCGQVSSRTVQAQRVWWADRQNPTGSIMPSHRYEEIYAIAQKHDLIM